MSTNKSKFFPVVLSIIFIVIIIYLFSNLEQPVISCSKSGTDDLGIRVIEDIDTKLEGNKIKEMILSKTIVLPEEYLGDEDYLDSIKYTLKKSYAYLDDSKVTFETLSDRLICRVTVTGSDTIILNNIEFSDSDDLQIKINSNTKSSEVVTLKIGDGYSEGEFKTRMKNNGYVCS